jgi:hypothetical protein
MALHRKRLSGIGAGWCAGQSVVRRDGMDLSGFFEGSLFNVLLILMGMMFLGVF